jgi:hypothetical protein
MKVLVQYGKDPDQIQALGLKKKSERKAPIISGKLVHSLNVYVERGNHDKNFTFSSGAPRR